MDRGLDLLVAVLNKYGRACLLCACADKNHCHRSVVAAEAEKRLGVKVVHI